MPRSSRCSALPCSIVLYTVTYLNLCAPNLFGEAAQLLFYSDHCSSSVPEASPDLNAEATSTPLVEFLTGYYFGGSKVFKTSSSSSFSSSSTFSFLTRQVLKTDRDGVLKIASELVLRLPNDGASIFANSLAFTAIPNDSLRRRRPSSVSFRLEGFWEESSGKVCMVGSSYSRGGEEDLNLKALLKLHNVSTWATITSLFTGTLDVQVKDIDRSDAISILMFPLTNYKYSLVSDGIGLLAGIDLPAGLEPGDGRFCSLFETVVYEFSLTYADHCYHPSSKNCTPFDFDTESLPPTMFLNAIGCSDDRKELRVLLQFSNGRGGWYHGSFDPKTALIGEGFWDKNSNQVHIVACLIKFTTSKMSFSAAVVEDCLISLRLSFPAMWSIRERNTLVGMIQSKKSPDDSGYFGNITARSTNNYISVFPDLNYEYTEAKRVGEFCLEKKADNYISDESAIYPNWSSRDLSFDISVQASSGEVVGSGFSYPVFVGNEMYEQFAYDIPLYNRHSSSTSAKLSNTTQFNISYSITISRLNNANFGRSKASLFSGYNSSRPQKYQIEISAEGVYDVETGSLCMVGCRSFVDSWDCEIRIMLQFPTVDSNHARGFRFIKGSIESTRERSNPLYFENLSISAVGFNTVKSSIWRMHLELSLVFISNTFSCIFVASLFFHVRKHPQVLPFLSVLMIAILALGHAIPLLLNFETLLQSNNRYHISTFLEAGRWLEVSEVIVKVLTLMTMFFELRLLHLSFSVTRDMKSWVAEKKALFALPLYGAGAFALLFMDLHYSVFETLKCCAGLVLDGFLLPQILLNMFRNSNEKVLSGAFYVGTTSLRLLPHLYDLWRRSRFVLIPSHFEGSYLYGIPSTDFYSTAWDVIIALWGLIFAVIIYLQQRFGGDIVVPQRFKANNILAYEKVPEITDL